MKFYYISTVPDRTIRSVYGRLRHLKGAYYGRNNGRRNTVRLDAVKEPYRIRIRRRITAPSIMDKHSSFTPVKVPFCNRLLSENLLQTDSF